MLTELKPSISTRSRGGAVHLSLGSGSGSGRIHPLYDGSATGHRDIELDFQQTLLADKYCQFPDDVE